MRIEIDLEEFEDILNGRFERIRDILRPDFFNDPRQHYNIGSKAREEEICQFLRMDGYEPDCKHGRHKWSCKECLK